MPSACEVTVRATHGSAGRRGSNSPPPWATWTPSTPHTSTRATTGRPTIRQRPVTTVLLRRGAITVSRASQRQARADEERVAEGPRGGALQLLVEVALELGRGEPLGGVEVRRREGAVQVGDPTLLLRQLAARAPAASAILSSGSSGASSTSDAMASWAGTCASWRSAVNTGVRMASPTTTPMWRAPIVHPACSTRGQPHLHRLGGEPVDGQPEPEPHERLRRDRPGELGRRQEREAGQSAGDEEAAHRDLDLGRRPQERGRAGGRRGPRAVRRTRPGPRSPASGPSPRRGAGPAGTAPP